MGKTTIEWVKNIDGSAGMTWNPIRGCSRVSEGCRNCYAERMAARGLPGLASTAPETRGEPFAVQTASGPQWRGMVELQEHMLDVPLRRKKATTYFVNSMSDLFHEALSEQAIDRVFAIMALCPQHRFQILTKRPARMATYFSDLHYRAELIGIEAELMSGLDRFVDLQARWKVPLSNVWLAVSCENQQTADERIPLLFQTPAAVRFVSLEPLLGPISVEALGVCRDWRDGTPDEVPGLDWVILGGESGPGARPCSTDWISSIVLQCKEAGTACFVKQLGAHVIQGGGRRIKRDKKGGDMDEWPHDLRVRQMPEVKL